MRFVHGDFEIDVNFSLCSGVFGSSSHVGGPLAQQKARCLERCVLLEVLQALRIVSDGDWPEQDLQVLFVVYYFQVAFSNPSMHAMINDLYAAMPTPSFNEGAGQQYNFIFIV